MTADELLAAFETFAEAPGGVERLRELVLELAVRGKLVPQDQSDRPASDLLKRVEKAKEGLTSQGRRRNVPSGAAITARDEPFEVPVGWCWARLGDLLVDGPTNGWSPKTVAYETGVRTLKLSATTKGVFDATQFKFVDAEVDADSWMWLEPGDLLIQRSNTPEYVGMAAVYDGRPRQFIYPDLMMRCRVAPTLPVAYVHLCLVAPVSRAWFREKASGTSQSMVKVGQAPVRGTPIPVPPLAEQHRIVARVDELMGLLDRLEAAQKGQEAARAAARDSALQSLRDAASPEYVEAAWSRVAAHIDELVTCPADVEPLRQTVLQLAVRGRLVTQDPEDEPARISLARVAQARAASIAEGDVRPTKALPPIGEDGQPFTLPDGWGWCRLQELASPEPRSIQSGPFGSTLHHAEFTTEGRLVIGIDNVQDGHFSLGSEHRIPDAKFRQLSKYQARPGDVLITVMGTIGRCCLVPDDVEPAIITKHVYRITVARTAASPRYLMQILRGAPLMRAQMFGLVRGLTRDGLNGTLIKSLMIPLPPLAEQHRIVAKVDGLMGLLDGLKERLSVVHDAQAAFAAAAVHHLDA